MASPPADDAFPGPVINEQDGRGDDDPIVCMNNYCSHSGTFAEFRLGW
ncbi:hypothetical protein [Arthrobacter rhizosphaerae]|nr:hypothetical protein [Arthrobacter rhizosphaerae]